MIEYSAGIVTAYGSAVRAGYTGTYEDFCRQQAQYADNALAVEQAKQTAVSASQSADQAKQDAQTASTTAQQSAQSASQSAQSAGQSAQDAQTAKSNAQTYAQSASQSAGSAQQSAQTAQAVLESIPEDYSDLSEDVVQLKADLGDKLDAYINVDFSIDNKRVNSIGSIAVSNGQRITDYYPCSEGTVVKWHGKSFIYGGASVMCLIAFFDADKAFITGITSVSGETTSVIGDVSAIAPEGTAYVVGSTTLVANYYLHVYDVNIDNIRAKIDGLPWDLSMIAPVETAYTATRNYTVGQLLIVDNTLYKVTSNIANGGTITAGTNVVATTLSEVIASLS